MENLIYEIGIDIILLLQGLGAWLVTPMAIFTFLGHHIFYLSILAILYWCVNARAGLRVGLLLMISGGVNYLFKISFASPRPYWFDERVLAFSTEPTFGVPSGHAQQAVALWGLLAASIRSAWAWTGAIGLILVIGISRLYLGVHFPHDVLLGWVIGLVLLLSFLALEVRFIDWIRQQRAAILYLFAFFISLALIGTALAVRLSLGDWTVPEAWQRIAAQAAPDAQPLEPLSFAGVISGAGAFFGLASGAIFNNQRGGFSAHGTWNQRLLRLPVGGIGAGLLFVGLGSFLPEAGTLAPLMQYLLYVGLGFWVAGLAPLLFIKLGLASKSTKPEV